MNKPLLLKPAAKDYLWGGSRLNDDFGKAIQLSTLAETWECSTHPEGQSLVAETGEPLGELLNRHLDYLGSHPLHLTGGKAELPILIKLIDAKQDGTGLWVPERYEPRAGEDSDSREKN